MGARRGGILIYALEMRLKERERENCSKGARPSNLLNIAPWWACLFLLAFLPFLLVPRMSYPCCKRPRSMRVHAKTKETSQQTSKETNGRKSMLKTSQEKMPNGAYKHVKNMKGRTSMLSNKRRVSQKDKCRFGSSVHSSIGLEHKQCTDSWMNMQASVQR